ncbi:MAG: TonB-dependent receptor [Betaproteobacteria bacterium]|nr:TonB-dependent receptor [Betaproteobacteria bacterium]
MSKTIRSCAFALALALSSAVSSFAADNTPVVITATRQPTRASELLSDVSVIERDAIEQAGQSSLAELLSRQPGIQSISNGGPGKVSSLFIRGANPNQTLVLVDGVRIGSATLGTPALEQLPLAQIERIEILRGPASALYGADAVGGVIQIFTRRGQGPQTVDAFAGIGSYNTRDLSAGISGGDAAWSYSVRGSNDTTDGIKAIADKTKQPYSYDPSRSTDGFRNSSLSTALTFRPASGHEIGATLLKTTGRNWYESGPNFDTHADVAQSVFSLVSRNRLGDGWNSTLRASQSGDDSTDFSPYSLRGTNYKTTQQQLTWQNDIKIATGSLLAAIESLKQKAVSGTNFDKSRDLNSLLFGWSGRYGDHRLQANLRRDENSQFGGKTTGYASYGYQLSQALRMQASLGSAFRAPTFNELYYPRYGNPGLSPENARNREVGLVWEQGTQRANVTIYNNRVSELIVTVCDASYNCNPVNVGHARLDGTSLSYAGQLGEFEVSSSLDILNARNAESGKRLPRRADRQMNLSISRSLGAWRIGSEWQGVGDRYDSTTETRHMGGYGLLNVFGRYAMSKELALEIRANNLGGKTYETAWGYGNPGANLFAGLRYSPK